ncbi:MAG: asparagine synthase-related protein [Solirubrobacteraceae bacterium]
MNEVPLYLVHDPKCGRSLVSSDPFVADRGAAAWGLEALTAHGSARESAAARRHRHAVHRDGRTPFPSVTQLPPGVRLSLPRAASAGAPAPRAHPGDLDDPLADTDPQITDPIEAGALLLAALERSVESGLRRHQAVGEPVGALLSAGVDSASVVTTAVRVGMEVIAYSAGTPWGNEHSGAAQLCRHLGIRHTAVELGRDDLIAAVPYTIRWLGRANPEKVDIALIATTLLRMGFPAERTILTGYGSDLINLGLPGPDAQRHPRGELPRMLDGVQDARHSGELSPLHYAGEGRALLHPFWGSEVVRIALATDPAAKLHRGREKGHLRAAMERHVPPEIAWRAKVAVHHGSGLQAGLDEHFGGRDPKAVHYADVFGDLVGGPVMRENPA